MPGFFETIEGKRTLAQIPRAIEAIESQRTEITELRLQIKNLNENLSNLVEILKRRG